MTVLQRQKEPDLRRRFFRQDARGMKHTDRRLAIVLELEMKGWQRAADLAATFGVSTRTIYRDMDALEEAGLPIVAVARAIASTKATSCRR